MDYSDKIAVNGVDLINRHELSDYQEKELQRFIDANSHILSWKDREKIEPRLPSKSPSNYGHYRDNLSRGPSPDIGYNKLDMYFKKNNEAEYQDPDMNLRPAKEVNLNGINYTTDFPGMAEALYKNDNEWLVNVSRTGSVSGSLNNLSQIPVGSGGRISSMSSQNGTLPRSGYSTIDSHYNKTSSDYGSDRKYGSQTNGYGNSNGYNNGNGCTRTTTTTTTTTYRPSETVPPKPISSGYHTYSNGRGNLRGQLPPSPYGSLKRKGVSWLDQERARSLSPQHNAFHQQQQHQQQTHVHYNPNNQYPPADYPYRSRF